MLFFLHLFTIGDISHSDANIISSHYGMATRSSLALKFDIEFLSIIEVN